jgi:4-amino-4-deoxy-L-arabinose transferase-like glycosyltransferase
VSVEAVADTARPPSAVVRPGARRTERTTLVVVGLTVLAAAIRFWGIGHQSFWYDEAITNVLVHDSPGKMLGLLPQVELTPPLYYGLAWIWVRIFGFGEAGLRSLSAVAGVVVVPALYGIGRQLISRRVGLVAAALAACNPLLIWYSQEARSYSLLVCFATLSLLAFTHVLAPRPSARWLVVWWLASGLTLATHYYGALAVVPEAAWLLWVHRRDRRVWIAVAAVAAVGGALMPIALTQNQHAVWIAAWPLGRRLGQIPPQLVLGTGAPARDWLKGVGAAAVLLALVMLVRRANAIERRGALLGGGLAITAFVISLLLVAAGTDELITRNIIVVVVPLIVFLAGGLGARRAGVLGLAGGVTLCTLGLVAAIAVAVDWQLQRPDWRGVARVVQATRLEGGDGRAIIVQNNPGLWPLPAYFPRVRFMPRQGAVVQEIDLVAAVRGPRTAWFCWWGSACNLVPSPLYKRIRLRGFRPVGPVIRLHQFSILRLRAKRAVRLTPHAVAHTMLNAQLMFGYALLLQTSRRR